MITLFISAPWILIVFLISLILPIAALVDIVKSKFEDPNLKIVWAVVVCLSWHLGSLLYFAIGNRQKVGENYSS